MATRAGSTGSTETEATQRPGFSREGKAYPGVDPTSGERKAVTYDGLQKEFGPRRGADLYMEMARAGGYGYVEGYPALSLIGLDAEHDAKVKKLLAEAEKKDAEKE